MMNQLEVMRVAQGMIRDDGPEGARLYAHTQVKATAQYQGICRSWMRILGAIVEITRVPAQGNTVH